MSHAVKAIHLHFVSTFFPGDSCVRKSFNIILNFKIILNFTFSIISLVFGLSVGE